MKPNPLKRALAEGSVTFGTWLTMGDTWATRVLARAGFDWLVVDLEHAPIDWGRAADLFALIADNDCVPLARIPSGSHDHVKRALDCGAWGIVVPMVDTAEQADAAVRAAKYPPHGNRSTGGGLHALSFEASADEYYAGANAQIAVIVQTESPAGIDELARICAVDGLDAVFVGPSDLRRFMHDEQGGPSESEFEQAIKQIQARTREAGLPCGIFTTDVAQARIRAQQGMVMIGIGSDVSFLTERAAEVLVEVRRPGS